MKTLIANIGQLVTMKGVVGKDGIGVAKEDLSVVEEAELLFENGYVRFAGPKEMIAGVKPDEIVDAKGGVVLPALVDPHTHAHIATGVVDSKFGFPMVQAEAALTEALAASNLDPIGLHFHLGSQLFQLQPYREAIDIHFRFAAEMKSRYGFKLEEFSPGGGLAIAYTGDNSPPAIAEFAEVISSAILDKCGDLDLEPPRLIVEPGRAIVGRAGVALYTVGSAKDIPGVRRYVSAGRTTAGPEYSAWAGTADGSPMTASQAIKTAIIA